MLSEAKHLRSHSNNLRFEVLHHRVTEHTEMPLCLCGDLLPYREKRAMHFTFTTAGESHGPQLTIIVTGMPAGMRLDRARINRDLARRQHGYGRGGRMKIEHDEAEIAGGVRGGETIGSPIAAPIRNRDLQNWREAMDPWEVDDAESEKRRVHAPRPGHADLVGGMKYNRRDLRDVLERASARETASRVAAGAMAKELLRAFGIEIRSGVVSLGPGGDPEYSPAWEELSAVDDDSPLRAVKREH